MKVRLFILAMLMLITNCITTIAPGIILNNTSEHIYSNGSTSYLGPGRLIEKVENCHYNSILLQAFYYGRVASIEEVLRESKIKTIGVVDYSSFSLFGPLFYGNCIIIRGDRK